MSPTTTPVVTSQTVPVLPNTLYREDSISDDGSEVMGGDTYYDPAEDIEDDLTYDQKEMEEVLEFSESPFLT